MPVFFLLRSWVISINILQVSGEKESLDLLITAIFTSEFCSWCCEVWWWWCLRILTRREGGEVLETFWILTTRPRSQAGVPAGPTVLQGLCVPYRNAHCHRRRARCTPRPLHLRLQPLLRSSRLLQHLHSTVLQRNFCGFSEVNTLFGLGYIGTNTKHGSHL